MRRVYIEVSFVKDLKHKYLLIMGKDTYHSSFFEETEGTHTITQNYLILECLTNRLCKGMYIELGMNLPKCPFVEREDFITEALKFVSRNGIIIRYDKVKHTTVISMPYALAQIDKYDARGIVYTVEGQPEEVILKRLKYSGKAGNFWYCLSHEKNAFNLYIVQKFDNSYFVSRNNKIITKVETIEAADSFVDEAIKKESV